MLGCSGPEAPAAPPVGAWGADGACFVGVRPFVSAPIDPAEATGLVEALAGWAAPLGFRVAATVPVEVVVLGDPLGTADLQPLYDWLESRSGEQGAGIDLVLVPALAAPDTLAARTVGTLDALGLSPAAVEALGADLPARFPPTLFASRARLHGRPDLGETLGHELAHLLGEPHRTGPHELLDPARIAEPAIVAPGLRERLHEAACGPAPTSAPRSPG